MPLDQEFAKLALGMLRRNSTPRGDFTAVIVGAIRAGVERSLDDAVEPSPERLKEILEEMKTIPYKIKEPITKEFRGILKDLPHPPGGRPRKLSDSEVIAVRLELGRLDAEGFDRQDAFKRVGRKYGVSARTIKRAWQGRKAEYQKSK